MAKIKISQKEIEKMLKDQLGIKNVKWDKTGNANVELDLDKIKEEEVKEEHHYHHGYPIYVSSKPRRYPYWTYTSPITTSGI